MPRTPRTPITERTGWHKSESSGCWSMTLGDRGYRVRIFQRLPDGPYIRETWIPGRGRTKATLRTSSRPEARARAEAFLRSLMAEGSADRAPKDAPLTLGELWRRYRESPAYRRCTPHTQRDKNDRAKLLVLWFKEGRDVSTLTPDDVERYAEVRARGTGWPDGRVTRTVGPRSVAADLQLFATMTKWATEKARLLVADPLRGLERPSEPNPRRPIATFDRFELVRDAARALAAEREGERTKWVRLELALMLAEATGRRIGSIAALQWDDIEQDPPAIRWRAEHDKKRREDVIPIPDVLAAEIRRLRAQLGAFDGGWCFPNLKGGHWTTDVLSQLLRLAEIRADVPKLVGGVWHPYRRKWATERKAMPTVDVKKAGGWRDTATLLRSYQQADDETVLAVMSTPVKLVSRKKAGNA